MKEITLSLTLDELNVLLAGLGKLPLEVSVAVFGKVKAQAESQLKEPENPDKRLLGQKFLEVKGEDFTNPKPPPPEPKKKRRLSKEPRPEKLDRFLSPEQIKELEEGLPKEVNFERREYCGAIPIDGETYAKDLNSASKRFVINYLHEKFEKALIEHQAFDPERNDIDFREIVKMIMETENLVESKRKLQKELTQPPV